MIVGALFRQALKGGVPGAVLFRGGAQSASANVALEADNASSLAPSSCLAGKSTS